MIADVTLCSLAGGGATGERRLPRHPHHRHAGAVAPHRAVPSGAHFPTLDVLESVFSLIQQHRSTAIEQPQLVCRIVLA